MKIQGRGAGRRWPEILYTVQSGTGEILACLAGKKPLHRDSHAVEQRCGGMEVAITLPDGGAYCVYLGIPLPAGEEVCIVEHKGSLYSAERRLYDLLKSIVGGED